MIAKQRKTSFPDADDPGASRKVNATPLIVTVAVPPERKCLGMPQHFLSIADSTRADAVLRRLIQHNINGWALTGGLAVSVKNFWQSYPAGLEVRHASRPVAELTAWLWCPDGPQMDMRHYDLVAHGLAASYEDVQPGMSTAYGVSRTSELTLYPRGDLPAKDVMVNALRLAGKFLDGLPRAQSPERTTDRVGFIHPHECTGTADRVVIRMILRDFELAGLAEKRALLESIVAGLQVEEPRAQLMLALEVDLLAHVVASSVLATSPSPFR